MMEKDDKIIEILRKHEFLFVTNPDFILKITNVEWIHVGNPTHTNFLEMEVVILNKNSGHLVVRRFDVLMIQVWCNEVINIFLKKYFNVEHKILLRSIGNNSFKNTLINERTNLF